MSRKGHETKTWRKAKESNPQVRANCRPELPFASWSVKFTSPDLHPPTGLRDAGGTTFATRVRIPHGLRAENGPR